MDSFSLDSSKWNVDDVIALHGCSLKCATEQHGLEPIDIYVAHKFFQQLFMPAYANDNGY